ncbi:beta and beta-prime subunits of DNA dependent RNA-polymerase [Plenodomus tracheiphilus IPT5]|uniref:DNA-directed RNA polymerase subunit beta n=1 Tax=Plenodomus tracheiphilus IPT5 TaxID=1408161 RepID=A0A6A7AZG1_9PLEO|nr:beta and beta-prime subunits of DNA dependent RNA-polymerase [Plenodomus tracheiphilus IPT5]
MAPAAVRQPPPPPQQQQQQQQWTTAFHTQRRQDLFQNPPKDKTAYPVLAEAVEPHLNSFNAIFAAGGQLEQGIKDIGTKVFLDGNPYAQPEEVGQRNRLSVRIQDVFLDRSVLPPSNKVALKNRNILPAECRERHATYRGKLRARLEYRINNGDWQEEVCDLGTVPIMLRSNRCHLEGMGPDQLIKAKEESEELGGYFIVNGIEKIIRMLQVNRRNYPMAIKRGAFTNRGPGYTPYGILIRSMRPDQTSQTNGLHYLNDGNVNLRFSWRKAEYLVPVMMILKALVETNDREIFEGLVGAAGSQGLTEKQFVTDRVELLLRTYKVYGLHSKAKTRAYLGQKFKVVLQIPDDTDDEEAGTEFLRKVVLPHLGAYDVKPSQDADKFRMLLFMIRKLYALVEGECSVDNPDVVQNQEILLGGQLFGMILKERLEDWLNSFRLPLLEYGRRSDWRPFTSQEFRKDFMSRVIRRSQLNIGAAMEYFLSTGNLISPTGLDLQQTAGFVVVAEKINFYRFISHFRMVHRGAFFAQLKTTTVRKLLPESWGFMCPVHTPDGAPCGLLNHFAHKCKLATENVDVSAIPGLVAQLGVSSKSSASLDASVVVQLDGRVLGFCSPKQAKVIADTLRYWKVEGSHNVPLEMEIGYVPNSNGGQYPGVYMFSQKSRMYRPVKYLPLGKLDYVGPFEQPYMSISCTDAEVVSGDSTHVEYDPTNIFSILANMTPFSDFNQSPRNMYQCLSADHEVLTNTGWKALPAIEAEDQVMTMDLQTGIQQWNTVQATTRLARGGSLYRLKSDDIDAVCNESHRWYLTTKDQPTTYTAYTTQQMLDNQLVALGDSSSTATEQWDRKSGTTTHVNHKIPTVGHNDNAMYLWPDCSWLPREFVTDEACNLDWCRLVGLVMGDGGINRITNAQGQDDCAIQIHQFAKKPAAKAYIEALLERMAAKLPGFVVNPPCVSDVKEKHTWTINHRDMYDFFLPMIRGPQSYDPLDDAMCRTYQAPHYQAMSRSDNEPILPVPAGWKAEHWWKLRRWISYPWLYLLARDQARAVIKGVAAFDGECGGVVRVFNSSLPLMHDMSVLGLLADTRVNIGVDHKKGEWMPSIRSNANATGWRMSFSFADSELAVAAPKPKSYKNPRHDGFVYCLTVPNGNFLARRTVEYSDNEKNQVVLDAAQKPFYTGNCQMGKQSMGTPGTALRYRTDNKTYRLQTGQTPIVRPPLHNEYGLDNFPNGMNAVVAVISYTGYDMDDAMILNKSAHERGFGYGTIYKTKICDLEEGSRKNRSGRTITKMFGFAPDGVIRAENKETLDEDGFPRIGTMLRSGDVIAAWHTVSYDPAADDYVNRDGQTSFFKYKEDELAFVEEVRIIGSEDGTQPCQKISIKLRVPRSPVIGDKFSSRHGQKGVASQKWPSIDMPFSESGIQPDVIINPHAFPSRMTIGMFVESLAGKAGALHGIAQDSTPFRFDEQNTAVDFFGHQLMKAGYNYYGNEPMYSGITGQELAADIYVGVVYYQRLRHMVNDKFQVRTTGPVNSTTGQPIKGRKKGGGIRVGEMERDALIAHGTAFLLQDRLMNCSDYTRAALCRQCGSFLSTAPTVSEFARKKERGGRDVVIRCRRCAKPADGVASKADVWMDGQGMRWSGGDDVAVVAVPGVLKYLDVELASMGVRLKFKVEP